MNWYDRRKRKAAKNPKNRGVDWDSMPLGKVADTLLALQTGRTLKHVIKERKKRGIPAANADPHTMGKQVFLAPPKEAYLAKYEASLKRGGDSVVLRQIAFEFIQTHGRKGFSSAEFVEYIRTDFGSVIERDLYRVLEETIKYGLVVKVPCRARTHSGGVTNEYYLVHKLLGIDLGGKKRYEEDDAF